MDESSDHNSHPLFIYLILVLDWLTARLVTFYSTLRLKTLLRLLGCRCGNKLRADGRVVVRVGRHGAVTIGNNVKINSRFMSNLAGMSNPTVFHCIRNGRICIGDNSGCSGTIFSSIVSIQVGRNVKIGANARIYDHDYHSLDYLTRRDPARDLAACAAAPVAIGDDVLIGANAIILKGVQVGDRSVIGAGAVVALKHIPAGSVVVGNPARILKSLAPTP